MDVVVIIPARLKSTRLPRKMLAELDGKPLIAHVYERACKATKIKRVIVATDNQEIFEVIKKKGGEAFMTSEQHTTGTDRIAEVVRGGVKADLIVNVQGDLILSDANMINEALGPFFTQKKSVMSTLKIAIRSKKELNSPHVVKVVTDAKGKALYFSRSPIPLIRDMGDDYEFPKDCFYKHYGLYVYQLDFLLKFVTLPLGQLENLEKLEQLRALENGYPIDVVETQSESWEIDTREDLARVQAIYKDTLNKQSTSHSRWN